MSWSRRALLVGILAAGFLATGSLAHAQTAVPLPAEDVVLDTGITPATSSTPAPEPIAPLVGERPGSEIVVPEPADVPDVSLNIDTGEGALSQTVIIILLLTVMSAAPGLLLLTTSFTRFAIVLGLTRNAIGSQNVPPTQVLVGLALFLTLFVMGPVLSKVNEEAIQPMLAGEMDQAQAFDAGFAPLRTFMLEQTDDDDLRMFMGITEDEMPETSADISASTLIPAFIVSELRTAFVIGFLIFVPFLVIDLIVSAVLMSMGMVMLPPVFISLPLKILLFVLVDGWSLIIGSVVSSVQGVT